MVDMYDDMFPDDKAETWEPITEPPAVNPLKNEATEE